MKGYNMILLGSRALNFYIPLKRVMHDWDFMMTNKDYEDLLGSYRFTLDYKHIKTAGNSHIWEHIKDKTILEIHTENGFTISDRILLGRFNMALVETPIGMAKLPSIQDLYDIKLATAAFIKEPKHEADVKLIESEYRMESNTNLYNLRYAETRERIEKEEKVKYDFFHKYTIPEYIKHDYLHEVIAQCMDVSYPTYKRIIDAEVNVSEELFNKLTHAEKVSLMVEESLVLALERWFIPQMVEKGINVNLITILFNNNEGLPSYKLLKHCCITGLKGEKEYITEFARANFFEIEKAWIDAKQRIKEKGGLPVEFYDILFKVRERYKNGEKVVTI